jgi:uncharacterized protein YbbC (DUF1343 family)
MINKSILKIVLLTLIFSGNTSCGQTKLKTDNSQKEIAQKDKSIIVGAERTALFLDIIKDKNIAIVANPSSLINHTHLVDSLLSLNINIKKVMSPEHGFRGNMGAGEHVKSGKDSKTGLTIISLYGSHKKPTTKDLSNIDILIFDLQDVGTRFYTYLSTLNLCMEACAENNVQLLILDRPNPNGHYVDGPILKKEYASFVGMNPIPIVHGMTLGELAKMINGEYWLKDSLQCDLKVITVENYNHNTPYKLPIRPSPNLPNAKSIELYPSLCLFEGTIISVGRGTEIPFQIYGHPKFKNYDFEFTPKPIIGAAPHPKLEGKLCKGYDLRNDSTKIINIQLEWLIDAYNQLRKRDDFFISFFSKLAGTNQLQKQIEKGLTAEEIRASWQDDLNTFKLLRKKYLLYSDFE